MKEEKRVPKRRFKEFIGDDAWEQRKLGDIAADTYGGGTPETSINNYWNGNIPWIQSSDLIEGIVSDVLPKKYITKIGLKKSATKLIPENSIAIITRVGVGKLAFIPYYYTTSQDFLSLSNLEIDGWFGTYSIYQKLQQELNMVQGTSIKGITKNELLDKYINIPITKEEQIKIGKYFKELDYLITLHQRKYDKLKSLKSAYLSEMFPQEGEKVPKRRFPGFTDAWEQRKLGDIAADTYGGGTPETSINNYWNGNIPWIQSSDLIEGIVSDVLPKKYITKIGLKKSATKLIPENSIAIITRVGVGKLAFIPYYYTTSQDFLSLSNLEIDGWFGTYSIYQKLQQELNMVQGTSIKGITKNELLDKYINIPITKEEQIKIGKYFKELDYLITLHQRKHNYKWRVLDVR